jgi:ubiquitin-protein ligase
MIDKLPFAKDEEEETYSKAPPVLIGRVLPRSDIYNQRTYKIEVVFPADYPFSPPEVRFLTPIYHPNVAENG